MKIKALILTVVVLMTMTSCKKSFELPCTLLEGDGFEIIGQNPIYTKYGQAAEFKIELDSGKSIVALSSNGQETDNYEYDNGILTIKNITAPKTFILSVGNGEKCEFWVESNSYNGGGFASSVKPGRVYKGTNITVTASPNAGAVFLGWSINASANRGGKIISEKEQYSFTIDKTMTLFANYDASKVIKNEPPKFVPVNVPKKESNAPPKVAQVRERLVEIIYDANGGTAADGTSKINTDFCIDYHTMPNSYPNDGSFVRDGYVLVGYNTSPDGNGKYVGMGHKFIADKDSPTTLYCMWRQAEPAESFEYVENQESVFITRYKGSSTEVYIPEKINGKKVTRIEKGAFSGLPVSSVYIPASVGMIADYAFDGCARLSEITFFDSLISVSDASFANSPIKKINLHAATPPRYTDSDLSFGKKYERLANRDKQSIIIVSGSSKHFGFDSDYAEALIDGKYNIVNYGTNAQMNVVFFLEAISNFASKGDIILYAPEQYGPYCDTVNGNPLMTSLTFQGCESCYDLFSYVDISQYTEFFKAFSGYSLQRSGMSKKSYEQYARNIDEYGDCAIPRQNLNSEKYLYGANGKFYFKADTIPAMFAENTNRIISIAQARGIKTLLSYPPYNKNACESSQLNDASFDEYNGDMDKVINAQRISDVKNFIYDGKYFYNTDYHLGDIGTKMHTLRTMQDLCLALDLQIVSEES